MGARKYDLVKPNYEALKADLKKYGLTADQLSMSMGKSTGYISQIFRVDKADRKTIEAVEDRMFREHGTYYTEMEDAAEAPTEPPKPQMTEGMGILLKQIVGAVNALSEKVETLDNTEELVNAIKEANDANLAVLQEILQKQKEMTTLAARILSNMERRQS